MLSKILEKLYLYLILRFTGIVELSRRAHIDCILNNFSMHNYKLEDVHVVKRDNFKKNQCPKNNVDKNI